MKKVLLYARVSKNNGHQTPETQLVAVREYVNRKNFGCPVEELVDIGESGSKDSRPALDRLMAEVRTGSVAAVVVYKLDRFGRSLQSLIANLNELKEYGTDFVSISEAIDTTTPQGKLMFHLLGAFAEFELSLMRERINSGIARARKQGTRSGNAIGRPRRIIDSECVLRMRNDDKMSLRQIASKLKTSLGKIHSIVAMLN